MVAPAEFRAKKGGKETGCPIRSVVTETGERLYFTPFDPPELHPAGVVAEDFWCSDDVVRAAGYRRPGETIGP
jgi:hypothetical protein